MFRTDLMLVTSLEMEPKFSPRIISIYLPYYDVTSNKTVAVVRTLVLSFQP